MSVDLPAFHAGTLMVKAKPKLFKLGWKQSNKPHKTPIVR